MGSSCSLWNILNQMGEGEGEGPVWKWKKNQDVDDDDLHFMQRALLKWRREASPPTLHRHIVIIIIISVTTTTKCFCESSERWELRSFKPCRNFTSFHFLMNAKTFALLTRRASSSAWCSVRLEGRPFLFRLLQLPHLYVRYVVFSGWEPLWVFVADTGDWRKEDGSVPIGPLPVTEVSRATGWLYAWEDQNSVPVCVVAAGGVHVNSTFLLFKITQQFVDRVPAFAPRWRKPTKLL